MKKSIKEMVKLSYSHYSKKELIEDYEHNFDKEVNPEWSKDEILSQVVDTICADRNLAYGHLCSVGMITPTYEDDYKYQGYGY